MPPVAAWSLTRALEKWRKAWSLGDLRLEFHPGDPGCNLSTGYPHLVRWGVWEFELNALVGQTYLLTPVQILSLALQPYFQLVSHCVS